MAEVKLNNGKLLLIDDSDYEFIKRLPLRVDENDKVSICFGRLSISRFILGITDTKVEVDHINRNRLDNRRINLRACTKIQNMQNRGRQKNNTSGYKGVWKCRDKWVAQIRAYKKKYVSKQFSTPEEAALEYDRMARKYHGAFAVLNFE